jgi:hypothetical protein
MSWYKQKYQGGYIYTRNSIPAVQAGIQGRIYDKWSGHGSPKEYLLGFPISSEEKHLTGSGGNCFQKGSWFGTPNSGAHAITGDVLLQWAYSEFGQNAANTHSTIPKDFRDGWKNRTFLEGDIWKPTGNCFSSIITPLAGRGI